MHLHFQSKGSKAFGRHSLPSFHPPRHNRARFSYIFLIAYFTYSRMLFTFEIASCQNLLEELFFAQASRSSMGKSNSCLVLMPLPLPSPLLSLHYWKPFIKPPATLLRKTAWQTVSWESHRVSHARQAEKGCLEQSQPISWPQWKWFAGSSSIRLWSHSLRTGVLTVRKFTEIV